MSDEQPTRRRREGDSKVEAKADKFEYDVDLASPDTVASASQLAMLEKRQQKLLDQLEELEDSLLDSEELRANLQRKLLLVQEEGKDFRELTSQRDQQNEQLRRDVDKLAASLQEQIRRRNEIESDRRRLENNVALLQTEAEQNERVKAKLDRALDELDSLQRRLETLITEKATAEQQLAQYDKKKADLDRKLQSETHRAREENNKTVTDLEQIIEVERKRCQDAIDYVRKALNAKIRVLELQLQDERESDSTFKKDKRKLDQELKEAYVQLEEHMAKSARDARKIESLERQIKLTKEQHDKIVFERNNLDTMKYSLERTKETIKAQLEAAKLVNEKLNSEVPADQKILLIDKNLEAYQKPEGKNSEPKKNEKEEKLFDTSISVQ